MPLLGPPRPPRYLDGTRINIAAACPNCGAPARFADLPREDESPNPVVFGCAHCPYESPARDL